MKKTSVIEAAMRHRHIVFVVAGMLVFLGIFALKTMPRQEFPSFTIRQGLVIGVYPGATSLEVEEQLTSEVEEYLFSYKEIKKEKTYSYSRDGMMIVFVELNDNINNSDEFWSKLNHGLNNLKAQLPSGVLALISNNDFGDTSALLITLESDQRTYRELEDYLDELERRLRRIESVSKLRHYGLQKEQISIYLEKEKLTNYGISSATLAASLFTQGFTTMSGTIENDRFSAPIHIEPSYNTERDIAEQIIYSDPAGNIIRLKDVARIVREYPDPDSYIANNGHKCLLVSMEMQPGENIVEYGNDVNEVLEQFLTELPDDVSIERIADQPHVVEASITTFLKEMMYAIIAVILVTMALVPFRVASVAATSIPITIFLSLGIMLLVGIELNTVSLAALIVVLGMIVDNSIVIVDSYMEKLDQGLSRWHAAISSAQEFFKAIFSATLAISITFFPFLFILEGLFRDFVTLFPWTIFIALTISLLVAMFLIPYFQYYFIKTGFKKAEEKKKKKEKRNFLDIIQKSYEKSLLRSFRHPALTIIGGILSVIIGLLLITQLPLRLLPIAERNQFAIEIYLPQGNSLEQTAAVADSLEILLKQDKRIHSVTSFIGTSSPRFHTTYAPNLAAKNYAQFIVNTGSNRETEDLLDEMAPKYEYYFPNAYIRFKQMDYQLASSPIEVRISGNNLDDLVSTSDSLISKMRDIPGLTWAHTNFEETLPGARINVNEVEANRLGITKTTVATNLAMRFDGLPLTTLWEKDYPIAVKLKSNKDGNATYTDVENEYIHSIIPGVSVPLRQIAKVEPEWSYGQIVRRNGVRTISVLGDVERTSNIPQVFSAVKEVVENQSLPEGIRIEYGGAHETDMEAFPKILAGLSVSILIIFFILLFHFGSVNLALLVLSSSSLSVFGAILGIKIMGLELGITGVLGIISLLGILVRNGIIMLDYAQELRRKEGKSVLEAGFEAGKRRMRPIFLTSMAASMGVVPMIISKSALWAPMGTVIFFGTLTSTFLLVMILPVAYWLIFRHQDKPENRTTVRELQNKYNGNKPAIISLLILLFVAPALTAQTTPDSSYTLEESRTLALENNAKIKGKALDIKSAEEVKKATFTKYFPQIEASAFAFKANDPLLEMVMPGGNLPVYDGNPVNLATASEFAYFPGANISLLEKGNIGYVSAVQPVFAGGRVATGNKLANLGVEVNELQMDATRNEILLETEKQYWQIVALHEKMLTLQNYIQMLDTLHKEVSDVYNAGLITRNDLLKVELKQNELKMNHLKLSNGIELAKMAFCQFIGIEYLPEITFTDSITRAVAPQVFFTDHQQALPFRPEYKLLQKSTKAEKYMTTMKRGEYLPQIGIGASLQYIEVMDDNSSSTGMIFGTIKIPISGWWEASHSLKERKIIEEKNQIMVSDNFEKLLLQMRQVKNTLSEAYEQVILAENSIRQAEENLKENRDNYEAGMINVSDILEAQALLQQAHDTYTDALVQYHISKTNYLQVTGR